MGLLKIIQIIIFTLGTLFLVFISRKPLKDLNAHGFYRFFVFEYTLVIVLINIPNWFKNPLSLFQIISWIFLAVSILLVIESFYYLKKYGNKKNREKYSANFEFENTIDLVETGIYKLIRHPMYSSLLFLAFGAMLKLLTIISVMLTVLVIIFLILTAKTEEKENIKFFGSAYEEYMKHTKMFVPFLF